MHEATGRVIAESKKPSVQATSDFKDALRAFLPALNRVSQQAAAMQAHVSIAQLDEDNEAIAQKYHGLMKALESVQVKHDRALDYIGSLRDAVKAYESEVASLESVANKHM